LISGAICASPVELGKEISCDTYKFDFDEWFEHEILKLAKNIIILGGSSNITCCSIAFRVMMKLMGSEMDRRVDYTYEDIHSIIKKNWEKIMRELNKTY